MNRAEVPAANAFSTLTDVVRRLRETGEYRDEEGEATDALESLLDATLNEERRKFQRETLRTSELSALLRQFVDKLQPEHTPGPWARDCDLCRLVGEANALLERPINVDVALPDGGQ